jgi:hypothetical protein
MSYHRGMGAPPAFTSTTAFAQAVDPYSWRMSPPGAIYSPYGWGPDMNIGMPANYTHHIGYVRTPIPGARRNIGMMRDTLPGIGNYDYPFKQIPFTTEGTVRYALGDSGDGLGAIFAAV